MFKICKKCKKELPLTNEYFYKEKMNTDGFKGSCKKCMYGSNEKYRNEHTVNITEYLKQYQKNNKNIIAKKKKQYREKNKDKIAISNKEYRKNNLSKCKTIKREWTLNNKEKTAVSYEKRRSMKKQTVCTLTSRQWVCIKEKFNLECAYCGGKLPLSQDHFVPLSKGGEYTVNNIIPACQPCNSSKHNYDFFEWYPQQKYYSKKTEKKILEYLNYDTKTKIQQLSIC